MTARTLSLVLIALVVSLPSATAAEGGPPTGFTAEGAASLAQLEAEFDAALDPALLAEWQDRLAARPHPVGSPWGRENAEFMAGLFREWGFETEIEQFDVLFPTPKARSLEMLEPEPFTASLAEEPIPEDPSSDQVAEQLPSYNAYSVGGDVTGELVYVNYGVPEDYEELDRRGISVEGRIVIARYGRSWRGIKPKVAAEKGAIGCILYSDPAGDGYRAGDPYPQGGYRPAHGVQRGSVADMPLYPGDPLTPFVGAVDGADRLPIDEAPTLTKIPVLPISWADAQPLLSALGGPVAPEAWRGALPLTYHLGPGAAKVRLKLEFDWSLTPAYNVVAKLAGSERPDEWILRGNHHDAWVNGATDPVSGMVAVLAEARAVGSLVKTGWRPKRTLVYLAWDAEEPGLLGSTEWVEQHAEELTRKAVAYINSDSNARGFFHAGGSHTLERLVGEVAAEVDDPRLGVSVVERVRAAVEVLGDEEERARLAKIDGMPLYPLGSGSDYTPFLQHLGIASLNIDFGGEGDYGQYHSVYDSLAHYRRFMDPEMAYGVALARIGGRLTLRLSESELLPFEFTRLAGNVDTYVDEVRGLLDAKRQEDERQNRWVREGLYDLAWNPADKWQAPETREPAPFLNFAPLENARVALQAAAQRYRAATTAWLASGEPLGEEAARELDGILFRTERDLTRPDGLPGRPWYRHYLYAPGFYTGYGVKTLPGVREAIELRDWDGAQRQIGVAAEVLGDLTGSIESAAKLVDPGS